MRTPSICLALPILLLSPDAGSQWVQTNGPYGGTTVIALAASGTNLFASTSGGVFLSTNNGTSWTAVNTGLTNAYVNAFAVSGTHLFAGTLGAGVFLSTNNGASWAEVNAGLTHYDVPSLAVSGTNLFAGTYGGGVFFSTNNGTSWTAVNAGLTNTDVWAFAVSDTNLFAGTYRGGVWRRPLSEMITDVAQGSSEIPTAYELKQNYPNPFNPSTTIKFELPKATQVNLSVYDVLGREVSKLVDDRKEAGVHEVKFDGAGVSSGVYLYKLQAGGFISVKKLLLLR